MLVHGERLGTRRREVAGVAPHIRDAQFIDGRALDSIGRTKQAMERYNMVLQLAPKESSEAQYCCAVCSGLRDAQPTTRTARTSDGMILFIFLSHNDRTETFQALA